MKMMRPPDKQRGPSGQVATVLTLRGQDGIEEETSNYGLGPRENLECSGGK